MPEQRKIIHIDMDAFYAAVEQRDNPQYRGKPVVVGGSAQGRGVVATASYEARKFGIHSAMPAAHAYRLCPHAIFVKPRFARYQQASQQIHAVLRNYSEQIEPLSLDEAYLDVSGCPLFDNSANKVALHIRQEIYSATALTASAGISYNKFLAKLASDIEKPNGQYCIVPEQGANFIAELAIGKFYGIGQATETRMHRLGIFNGADLRTWNREQLAAEFGKLGDYYYNLARGIDHREVHNDQVRKSIGSETTYETDLSDVGRMASELDRLAREVGDSLAKRELVAFTLSIKVKYANFQQVTRSQTVSRPIAGHEPVNTLLRILLARTDVSQRSVRLLGVSLSNLRECNADEQTQLELDLG